MLHRSTLQAVSHYLATRPTGCTVDDIANHLGIEDSEINTALRSLAANGVATVTGNMIMPVQWRDLDRVDVFLNVSRLPEQQFQEYCSDIDDLVHDLRGRNLPVVRPYTNETLVELLLTVGAASVAAVVASALASFVERVTTSRRIPYIEITATRKTADGTELLISVRGKKAEDVTCTLDTFVQRLSEFDSRAYPIARLSKDSNYRKLFISYRRGDTQEIAGRIYDVLGARYGAHSIFMDIDTIPAGLDFRRLIYEAIDQCQVMLALIGQKWLTFERNGNRCLDDPGDFVRIEIEAGMKRGIPVIPLLIGDASMPIKGDLPETIVQLAYRQGIRIDPGKDFHNHMDRVIGNIDTFLQDTEQRNRNQGYFNQSSA